MPVRARRADDVTAAVQIEHDGVGGNAGRCEPFGRTIRRGHLLDLDVGRGRENPLGTVVLRPALLDGERACRRQLRQVSAYGLNAPSRHDDLASRMEWATGASPALGNSARPRGGE